MILTWPVDGTCARGQNESMGRSRKKAAGGDAPDQETVEVVCPCCQTRLLLEAGTGVILREDRQKEPGRTLGQALAAERTQKSQSDERFRKALKSQHDRERALDRKFEEAVKKAADDPEGKPPHPFDWD